MSSLKSSMFRHPPQGPQGQASQSKAKAFLATAKWSLSKHQVFMLLERLSWLQQYANTLLLDFQHTEVSRLDAKVQGSIDMKMRRSVLRWLSPLQMAYIQQ